jgi:SAM-dependent methyltransferase
LREDAPGVSVLTIDEKFSRFRLNAGACLAEIGRTLENLWESLPMPGRVICVLENRDNCGLDDFEAEAVFAPWLDVELLAQLDRESPLSSVLIAGRLRQEVIGLTFHLDHASWTDVEGTRRLFELLSAAELPVCTVFIKSADAAMLNRLRDSRLRRSLQEFLKTSDARLGLWVSDPSRETTASQLRIAMAPLMDLGQHQIQHLRFATEPPPDATERLHKTLNDLGKVCDSSVQAPYFLGAYQPHSFDLRTPSALWHDDQYVELASIAWKSTASNTEWIRFWDSRLERNSRLLRPLLTFKRMADYLSRLAADRRLNERYNEYRVYNWRRPEPSPRCTLLDCGSLQQLNIVGFKQQIQKLQDKLGFRWHVAGHQRMLESARAEARRRVAERCESILENQIASHEYLSNIPATEPLRADIQDFAEFISVRLECTLEIASGGGHLARALRQRAETYVCLELTSSRVTGSTENRDFLNVVADAHHLPFGNASFDTVVANNILEHFYDPVTALRDIYCSLKAGGKLFALIPLDQLNPKHNIRTHLWKADEQNIRAAFTAAGFIIARLEIVDLYALGVDGCFPTCNGLACKIEACKP